MSKLLLIKWTFLAYALTAGCEVIAAPKFDAVTPKTADKISGTDVQGLNLTMSVADMVKVLEKRGYVLTSKQIPRGRPALYQFRKNAGKEEYPLHIVTLKYQPMNPMSDTVSVTSEDLFLLSIEYDYFHRSKQNHADQGLLYVEAYLPLASTRRHIREAQQAILREDMALASQTLAAAGQQTLTVSLSLQSPLLLANEALTRGWANYRRGDNAATNEELSTAGRQLRLASQMRDPTIRRGALELLREIAVLQQEQAQRSGEYRQHLQGAWQRISALSKRESERLNPGRDPATDTMAVRENLIEAKLCIDYARIDHLILQRESAAEVDLGEADGFLSIARTRAPLSLESSLQAVSLQLAELVTALEKKRAPNRAAYAKMQERLSGLIDEL